MANYTVRDNSRQIDVAITGGPGNESWTVTAAPPFTFEHFRETGSGSKTLTGPIIDGREYEITVDPITGYDIPPVANVTAGVSTQTFNVTMSAEGNTGDLSIVLSPNDGQGWTLTGPSYPGGFVGNGSTSTPLTITQGQYQIAYDDDRIHLISPPNESKALGAAATFTGTYTTRASFTVNVTILDDGDTPTGDFGLWDIANDDGLSFEASGNWDINNSPVVPLDGGFYEGRNYTLDFRNEDGYTPLVNQAITQAGTYVGDYQRPVSGACDAFPTDVWVSGDTWSPAVALTPSSSTAATADFYLRPTVQNQGALIGFAKNTPIWDYSDCVALIRFSDLGTSRIDVRDGGAYCSDGGAPTCTANISYTAGHWYHFVVDFDITNKRYTVQVEDCNDGLVVLHQSAAFRTDAAPDDDAIGYWALNAFTDDIISAYGMDWDAEGTTPPTTGTISINVTPETGNWTLNGPNFYQLIGTGDRTAITGLAFGDYTITYGGVSGYDPPATNPDNVTLSSGNPSHPFLGTYRSTGTQSRNIYGIGHSLLGYSGDILKYTQRIVETMGHSCAVREQNIPGSPIKDNWEKSFTEPYINRGRVEIPADGTWDTLIMTEYVPGQYGSGNDSVTYGGLWRDLGLDSYADTPDCKAYFFTTWDDRTGAVRGVSTGASPDPAWYNEMLSISGYGPDVVSRINAADSPPRQPLMENIQLGPVYMAALYNDIYDPAGSEIQDVGYTQISDFFGYGNTALAGSDPIHLGKAGRFFQACVFVSHIFGLDVRGASTITNFTDGDGGARPGPDPTAAQQTALKNLAFRVWSS
jgi:hypothetical protein